MLVRITKPHVSNGIRGDTSRCPVALALRDAFPKAIVIDVFILYARIDGKEYNFPMDVALKIFEYDKTGALEPFEFEI